jgi:hypothetical protein
VLGTNPKYDWKRLAIISTLGRFLKVAFQGPRVTSDAGLVLVRELDEHLGLEASSASICATPAID